ncbi:MAG TPA: chemotaxis protein CheW [Pilimelia sp.]|nr:chemotaxis protein CheW [Pilimelia sp.]
MSPDEAGSDLTPEPVLLFRAGPLLCGLPLPDVVETLRPLPTRALAGTPACVRGVCVLRGAPVPVLDAAVLLTGSAAEAARFLSVRAGRGPVALATGPVLGVVEMPPPAARGATLPAAPGPALPAATDSAGATAAPLRARAAGASAAGLAVHGDEPLLLLSGATVVPDAVAASLDDHAYAS